MSKLRAVDEVQNLVTTGSRRISLTRGELVEVHLDTGEVLEGTLTSLRSRTDARGSAITARSKKWSRWRGTPADLLALVQRMSGEIEKRSSEDPPVSICLTFTHNDEERYFDIPSFEREIGSVEKGSPGDRLREIRQIDVTVGPTDSGALKASAIFGSGISAPGVALAVEGADRTVVSGLKEELALSIDSGCPRMPALNTPAQMLVGGLLGAAYFRAIFSVDWGFLSGWLGQIAFLLIFLAGFIGLLYALAAVLRGMLPPLQVTNGRDKTPSEQWVLRIGRVVAALVLAGFPFVLERIFGK